MTRPRSRSRSSSTLRRASASATSLDESLLVEAAAGTGKTTELVRRVVAVIADGRMTPERGGQGHGRPGGGHLHAQGRGRARAAPAPGARGGAPDGDRRRQCGGAADTSRRPSATSRKRTSAPSTRSAPSSCASGRSRRGSIPAFESVSDEDGPRLFAQAFNGWIQETLQEMPEGVRRALVRMASKPPFGGQTPLDRLMQAGLELVRVARLPRPVAAAERRSARRDRHPGGGKVQDLAELARRCRDPRDGLRVAIDPAEALAGWVERVEAVGAARLRRARGAPGRPGAGAAPALAQGPRQVRRRRLARRGDRAARRAAAAARAFRDLADADLAGLLRHELEGLLERYDEIKRRHGQLDFVDLMVRTRDLLRRDRDVRRFFQERFTHIFVDEFQDTDPLQTEILLLLAADDADETDWRSAPPGRRASCSWSAIPSSRSTASAAPTSSSTRR